MEKSRKSESASNHRNETADNDAGSQPSPGATFQQFLVMEDLIDKMKLLKYDSEFVKEHKTKPLSRYNFILKVN
jgi:hypothetical protein